MSAASWFALGMLFAAVVWGIGQTVYNVGRLDGTVSAVAACQAQHP